MKYDAKRQEYEIIVIGDEPHLAYNRVGLTTFFEHRMVEKLYLNPKEWVSFSIIQQAITNSKSTMGCQKALLVITSTL
jgi:NAD(P)H-nitrite reductase large subunit